MSALGNANANGANTIPMTAQSFPDDDENNLPTAPHSAKIAETTFQVGHRGLARYDFS